MRARFDYLWLLSWAAAAPLAAACGSDVDDDGIPPDDDPSLEDYLPEVPEPTGEDQGVWAGEVTSDDPDELLAGPAQTAMHGDFYIRNERAHFMIGAATRVVGVVPHGGNLVGAAPLDEGGEPVVGDHFGELSFLYLAGRTCEAESVEVVRDGSGGGAAVIRSVGTTAPNDYLNLRGVGILSVPRDLDPDIDDEVQCATTYTLEPGSRVLDVQWTLFNPREGRIHGPFTSIADTGGDIEAFAPTDGFERLGIGAITAPGDEAPVDYVVYQGPGVSYGAVPVLEDADRSSAHFFVAGVSLMLYGGESLLDILNEDRFHLDLEGETGVTHGMEFIVGEDAAAVEADFLDRRERGAGTVAGEVTWEDAGDAVSGARVGVFSDQSGAGAITGDDPVRTYTDTDEDGRFEMELAPGDYHLRADVEDTARSGVAEVSVSGGEGVDDIDLELPDPAVYDYTVTDGETGDPIPAKITVIGEHPAEPTGELFDTYDRESGVVRMIQATEGTSVIGAEPDEPLRLPAGGEYRVIATRGTEYSYDSEVVEPEPGDGPGELQFELWRTAAAEGYVSSEFHVHAIGSPDSPVQQADRVATAVADGVEVFAQTDHDYVADLQPTVEELGLEREVRAMPGVEVTPFVYGHFNAFPLEPDETSPNRGAIDWAEGEDGYAMLPGAIFDEARDRGADVVQINHPRASAGSIADFQHYFDRTHLAFDYEDGVIFGDVDAAGIPNEWLRLPEEVSLWDSNFDAVEVWNGFDIADTNEDGVRETARLDLVLADWFNFLSFGFDVTPIGSSDTHTIVERPMGMPRTYVRVDDDSPAALESGRAADDVVDTLTGSGVARDVVVTSAPLVRVSADGAEGSVLGRELDAEGGDVTLEIEAIAPDWADLDTIEIFANATPPIGHEAEPLEPIACFTALEEPSEPCEIARTLDDLEVEEVEVEGMDGATRLEATVSATFSASDVDTREGAQGEDAWFVVRARGTRGIFPIFLDGILSSSNVSAFVNGSEAERDSILSGRGVPPTAVTAPVYVDFDGGGYRAPFAP